MEPSNHKFHHPYEPYDIQLEFMQKLYQCIEQKHVGIFESPTGTGKSLSLICAALTWLRDDERRSLFGEVKEGGLDWLEQAELKAQQQQLLETRKELEDKLQSIRDKNVRKQGHEYPIKKVKTDDQIQEHDLVLDDYESDRERNSKSKDEASLSSATLALLEKLQPAKSTSDEDQDQSRTRIIFCSRTHSQLTQFVNELRKVRLSSGVSDTGEQEVIKHISLGSRKNLCINPKVYRLTSTTAMNERCLELQKPGISQDQKCAFLPSKVSSEDKERVEAFKDNMIAQIQDIEDIAMLGKKMKLCPYYASRSAIAATEVITLPYPLLLQRNAREALGVEITDNVIIIDEAHNLTSAIADTLSVSMPLSHLELAQKQLLGYCQKFKNKLKGKNRVYIAQIIKLLKSCISQLQQAGNGKTVEASLLASQLIAGTGTDQIQPHKLVNYIQLSKLIFKIEGYAELLDQQAQSRLPASTNRARKQLQPKGVLAEFQSLLVALMNPASEGRFFINRGEQELILKYTLLDPQAHFEEIVKEARAVILAGGTMSPMGDWSEQLFSYVEPQRLETYSFGHIIDKANVLVQPLSQGPSGVDFDFTFANRRSETMILELASVVEKLCFHVPDGMVVFFPSYDYLALITSLWKRQTGNESAFTRISTFKQIFQENKEVNVDDLLREYSNSVISGRGALMFAVVGGKLSEGINFADKLGRVVICVGLPYPNIQSAEWKAKVEYIERMRYAKSKSEGLPEADCKIRAQAARREYADNTTMRAVNQSIGRAIRHKNDYAAIYLVDKRYATPRIQAKLPAWLKESVRSGSSLWKVVEEDCARFFEGKQN
ncbi:ATP-dependent DNA helicase chl1 [Knufia fluminis]|uniref:ATP-dependent DNA helicase CHL1 n=1 Tax=Knufia fluminis TaxID=191047 RepID=A0AAN8F836_9EURO|nr:ATP-dependent DNA helicase chl1 [Knufia fluminis]